MSHCCGLIQWALVARIHTTAFVLSTELVVLEGLVHEFVMVLQTCTVDEGCLGGHGQGHGHVTSFLGLLGGFGGDGHIGGNWGA